MVKLGSNLFFDDGGDVASERIFAFIDDMAAARLAERQIIVVSSGAVALGANALKVARRTLRSCRNRRWPRLDKAA